MWQMVRDINERQGLFIDGQSYHSPIECTGSGVAEVLMWICTSRLAQAQKYKNTSGSRTDIHMVQRVN